VTGDAATTAGPRETATLTLWANGLRWQDVPDDVRFACGLHFVDAYGVAVATGDTPSGQRLLATLPDTDAGPAHVIGRDRGVDPMRAALVNGTLVHGLEFDDTHIPSVIHGSAVALAATLSQAHRAGVTLGDVLTGFLVTWETMIRLGLLAPGGYQARGFQTAAVCGPPAAALAVGRLQGLGPAELDQAFAVATSYAGGLMAYAADGATVKRSHLGWAAHGGVVAAELAGSGMTGPTRPLTGSNAFLPVLAGIDDAADVAGVLDNVGGRWHLLEASYKLHPVCHYIHAYLDLVADLRQRHPLASVAAIHCHVHPAVVPVITDDEDQRRHPRSVEEAQYSLHFAVASMYLHGACSSEELADPHDPRIREVAQRVHAVVDPDLAFPGMFPAVIRLLDDRGELIEQAELAGPHGATVPRAELVGALREKFVRNTASRWTASAAGDVFDQLATAALPAALPAADWPAADRPAS
jgi:2-methylcitrate dehydratase PrpD